MDVNYLTEINGLDDWEFGNPLSATAYKVMRKLLMLANRQRFPERIPVSNTSLCFLVGCTEKSLIAARQQLIQRGLIEYRGKKKQTPVYTIHYFSLNPRYNRKNYSYGGGIEGGIEGSMGGGYAGGTSINNTYGWMERSTDDEEDNGNIPPEIPQEDRTIGNTPLLHPFPAHPSEGVHGQSREPVFPPRNRELTGREMAEYAALRSYLDQPAVAALFGRKHAMMRQLADSDAYPLELVGYAMSKARQRNEKYPQPLDDPAEYAITLLNDWKSNGLHTVADVQEWRGDWAHEN